MNEMRKIYTGPCILESYAMMINNHPLKNKTDDLLITRFIGFSLPDKIFYIKESHTDSDFSEYFIGKSINSFNEYLLENEKELNPFSFGLSIVTGTKKFIIFLETKELYYKWLRILNFFIHKIDIENKQFGVLKGFLTNEIDRDITPIGQNFFKKFPLNENEIKSSSKDLIAESSKKPDYTYLQDKNNYDINNNDKNDNTSPNRENKINFVENFNTDIINENNIKSQTVKATSQIKNINLNLNNTGTINNNLNNNLSPYNSNSIPLTHANSTKNLLATDDLRKYKINSPDVNKSFNQQKMPSFDPVTFNENLQDLIPNNNYNDKSETAIKKENKISKNNLNSNFAKTNCYQQEILEPDNAHVPNFGVNQAKTACYEKDMLESKKNLNLNNIEGLERNKYQSTKPQLGILDDGIIDDFKSKKDDLSPIQNNNKQNNKFSTINNINNNFFDFNFNNEEKTKFDSVKNLYKNTYINDFYTSKKLNNDKENIVEDKYEQTPAFNTTEIPIKISTSTTDQAATNKDLLDSPQNAKKEKFLDIQASVERPDKEHLKKYQVQFDNKKPNIDYVFDEETNSRPEVKRIIQKSPNKYIDRCEILTKNELRNLGKLYFFILLRFVLIFQIPKI